MPRCNPVIEELEEEEEVEYIKVKVMSPGITSSGKIYASVDTTKKGISHVSNQLINNIDRSMKH